MTPARLLALKILYPTGNVMNSSSGVVDSPGLKVSWVDSAGCIGTKNYEPGQTVPIIVIEGQTLKIDVGVSDCVKKFEVGHGVFSDWS